MRVLLLAAVFTAWAASAAEGGPTCPPSSDPAVLGYVPGGPPLPADIFVGSPGGESEAAPPLFDLTRFAGQLDVGIPDGAGLSAVFRPFTFLRASAGGTYNYLGYGVRAGVSLIPFYFPITPSLNFDVGHYFPTDLNPLIRRLSNNPNFNEPALSHFNYDYANAHLGLEMGAPHRFVFFLRGGISYIQTSVPGALLQSLAKDPSLEVSDLAVRAVVPSLKLGFIVYFL